eukprot:CAMPEP_0174236878 /NCGR_PEP_ID=MMETSP0417-20130205/6268_1 /TAXON_ID=242541 /ORGANISM="Mayorella sp, Strain BSH-02190019" /LENGTH=209 /DNA_ID=CAMNT_0015315575 /DNA_START=73 /DNA_END=702 /DNA_ORIENTATION=-
MSATASAPAPATDLTKLFVGNLSFSIDDAKLQEIFSECGTVVDASVILRGTRSRGYGFVTMSTEAEAQKAVDTISGRDIEERPINVEIAKARAEGGEPRPRRTRRRGPAREPAVDRPDSTTTLFVANLPFSTEDADLVKLFSEFDLKDAHVVTRRTGRSKGFGFATFNTQAAQQAAQAKMDGFELEGRPLVVKIAKETDGDEAAPADAQ